MIEEFWIEFLPRDNRLTKLADFSVKKFQSSGKKTNLLAKTQGNIGYAKLPLYVVTILTVAFGLTIIIIMMSLMHNFYLCIGAEPLFKSRFLPYALFP